MTRQAPPRCLLDTRDSKRSGVFEDGRPASHGRASALQDDCVSCFADHTAPWRGGAAYLAAAENEANVRASLDTVRRFDSPRSTMPRSSSRPGTPSESADGKKR